MDENVCGILHGGTMQRTVLPDECPTVDTDRFPSGEGLCQGFLCFQVVEGLPVCRIEHGFVHDQEIGVGGGQSPAEFVVFGQSHGER